MRRRDRVDVQIRGVPATLRQKLGRRARSKGLSMSQYVIKVLSDDLARPTIDEWLEEVRKDPPAPNALGAEIVRELRDSIDRGVFD